MAITESSTVEPTLGAPRRAKDNTDRNMRLYTVLSLLLGGVIWEVLGRYFLDEIFFASFSRTVRGMVNIIQSGVLFAALLESLQLFVTGFVIAVMLALTIGVVVGRLRLFAGLEAYITVLYIMPNIVLIPFILSIIGFGFWPKILVVVLFIFFPVCINTLEGVRATPKRLVEVGHSFGANEWGIWKDVVIPSTVPYAMTGIRQGIARGLVGMVAAEFLLDPSGLGALLLTFARRYQMENLLAAVVVVVVLGLLVMAFGRYLEGRFAAWRN